MSFSPLLKNNDFIITGSAALGIALAASRERYNIAFFDIKNGHHMTCTILIVSVNIKAYFCTALFQRAAKIAAGLLSCKKYTNSIILDSVRGHCSVVVKGKT